MDLKEFWGPHKGAVSLTFDDGSPDHLERAIPRLNEYDIRGTFYLLGGGDRWREQLAPWVAAARQGHEIGNHSLTHTCSNSHDGGNRGLEYRSLQQMEDEILKTQERLSSVFTEQKDWTYCYPCYNLMVGRGTTKQSYTPVIAKHFLAGRAGGEFGLANHPAGVDLSCVTGTAVENCTALEMIGLCEELAVGQNKWVVLVFHTIDGDCLPISRNTFTRLLLYLRRRRNEIWTAPFGTVARKIADWQASHISA